MLVKITNVPALKPDNRGLAYGFSTRESTYFIIINRKKGTVSGRHYHKGLLKSKSPEIFYLVDGKIKLIVKDMESGETEEYKIEKNHLFEIPAKIYHEVHALTNVILLELNNKDEKAGFNEDTIR